jgi:hypothetical protein
MYFFKEGKLFLLSEQRFDMSEMEAAVSRLLRI